MNSIGNAPKPKQGAANSALLPVSYNIKLHLFNLFFQLVKSVGDLLRQPLEFVVEFLNAVDFAHPRVLIYAKQLLQGFLGNIQTVNIDVFRLRLEAQRRFHSAYACLLYTSPGESSLDWR